MQSIDAYMINALRYDTESYIRYISNIGYSSLMKAIIVLFKGFEEPEKGLKKSRTASN